MLCILYTSLTSPRSHMGVSTSEVNPIDLRYPFESGLVRSGSIKDYLQ